MDLKSKTALITGAANGIGLAITERLATEGMNIVAFDIEREELKQLSATLGLDHHRLELVVGDVSSRDDVRGAVERALERFETLDVAAANAGIAIGQPFLEINEENWQRVLNVNLNGAFFTIQEAAKVMAKQGQGSIVVTTSTNGFYVETNLAPYNASKGGIDALVRSAAIDLASYGIRVNSVAPSMVKTRAAFVTQDAEVSTNYLERVPMRRFADPPEIAAAVAFLASEESSFMTGQRIILDGGLTLGVDIPMLAETAADS